MVAVKTGFVLILVAILGVLAFPCTDVLVSKGATVDGSVITTHTCDGAYDSRLIIVPAADHAPGTMASVWKGMIRAYPEFSQYPPMVKLGEIPEVPHTYKIFKIAYPFANEHQVMIGENTIGRASVLAPNLDEAILYIEQLEYFGLQRAKTARECILVMGELAEKYGYADTGEGLAIADPNEVWLFEIYPVGPLWTRDSGKPGAVWAAARVPDGHVAVQPNRSRIGEIDPHDTENFMVSSNYMSCAIELGLYDPASGEPFVWRFVYRDVRPLSLDYRTWRLFNLLAPSGNWQIEDVPNYPFSFQPDKILSLADIIEIYHDVLEGTEYDVTEAEVWYYTDSRGNRVKSPYATPQVQAMPGMAAWLGLSPARKIAISTCSYFFVGQVRDWLPNEIGAVAWFGLNNPATSPWIPVWVGVEEVPVSWTVLDRKKLDRNSAWWAFDMADTLVNQRYGNLKPILDAVRDPFQQEINTTYTAVEQAAILMYESDPKAAVQLLTNFTYMYMLKAERLWWDLVDTLLFRL